MHSDWPLASVAEAVDVASKAGKEANQVVEKSRCC
jgi:hypothetical protein